MGIGFILSFLFLVFVSPYYIHLLLSGTSKRLTNRAFNKQIEERFDYLCDVMEVSPEEERFAYKLVQGWFAKGLDYVCDVMEEDFRDVFGENFRQVFFNIHAQHMEKHLDLADVTWCCALLFAKEGRSLRTWGFSVPLRYCDDYEINLRMCNRIENLRWNAGVQEKLELLRLDEAFQKGFRSDSSGMLGDSGREYFMLYPASQLNYSEAEHYIARLYFNEHDGKDGFSVHDLREIRENYDSRAKKNQNIDEFIRTCILWALAIFMVLLLSHC